MTPNQPFTSLLSMLWVRDVVRCASWRLICSVSALVACFAGAPALAFGTGVGGSPATVACGSELRLWGGLGYSFHYFPGSPDALPAFGRQFDAEALADQLQQLRAGWLLLTLQHQNWILLAPSQQFARVIGRDDRMSDRDLVLELGRALQSRGIKLLLYVNVRFDDKAKMPPFVRSAMGSWPPDKRLMNNLVSIYSEFSRRYGSLVAGWWVDGTWHPGFQDHVNREHYFSMLAEALRAGNPGALITFNPGVGVRPYAQVETYTAGEIEKLNAVPDGRCLGSSQWHAWTFLGSYWARDRMRVSVGTLCRYLDQVLRRGGAMTLDLGVRGLVGPGETSTRPQGGRPSIDSEQFDALSTITRARRAHDATAGFECQGLP